MNNRQLADIIKILSVIQLLFGSVMLFNNIILFKVLISTPVGPGKYYYVASTILAGFLLVLSGLGMLFKKKWSWWIASFFYMWGIFRLGNSLKVLNYNISTGKYHNSVNYTGEVLRIVICGLILLFLFRTNTLSYLGIHSISKKKALSILTVITGLILLCSFIIGSLYLNNSSIQ